MSISDRFEAELDSLALKAGSIVVAVSGGPDSVALLDLVAAAASRHGLLPTVAHADHGIDPRSGDAAATVVRAAASYGLPVEVGQLRLGPLAGETAARRARYQWLEEVAARLGAQAILTGHHADDQAETALMRLLAGSGPAGLAGMQRRRGAIARPLLPFRRSELAQYVQARGLSAWSDPANADPIHLRSWIRTAVLPVLERRIPDLTPNLLRSARMAAADRDAWDRLLSVLPALECREEGGEISVAAAPLLGYDSAVAAALLRAMGRRAGCTVGERAAGRVLELASRATSGRVTPISGGWEAELSFGRLRFMKRSPSPGPSAVALSAESGNWGPWQYRCSYGRAPAGHERDAMTAWFVPGPLTIRPARPGDMIRPIRGNGRRPVAKCFQEARIPRSRRSVWPVFEMDGSAVWVPGVCRADRLVPAEGAEALRVEVAYP